MLKRLITMCLVLMIAAPALAQTVVPHVSGHISGWRGGNNYSASYCWLDGWPKNGAWAGVQDACVAEFLRADLQTAINGMIAGPYKGWDAKIVVTQPEWVDGNPKPAETGLGPVLGSVQVDTSTLTWLVSQSLNAGTGQWTFGGTGYGNFADAVAAGVTAGKSVVFDTIPYTVVANGSRWDVVMDAPESLIVQYMKNTAATGLFVSAKVAFNFPAPFPIYMNQASDLDIRVIIDVPAANPWINCKINNNDSLLWVDQTIIQGNPAAVVPVQVNARFGTLAWTATESPDATWLSLSGASGANGGTFQMTLNPAGVSPGTYNTTVIVSDPNSVNKSVSIPVTLTVQANSPVIQLVPASLSFQATPTGANPASQSVTVNNAGSGTLAWTAAENPDVAWLSLTNTTGGNGAAFTVNVNKTGLSANVYTASIRVSDPNASNSPQNVDVTLLVADQDANVTTANSYDDAWQTGASGWIAAMKNVRANRPAGVTATSGFCVFLGDSITYSSAFGAWARGGTGKTTSDTTICNWSHAGTGSGTTNITNDGWFLAKYDYPGRNGSFTARSGITAAQYLTGLTYPDLPSIDQMFTAGFTNPDSGNKQYRDAEIAVILLGTNDLGGYTDVQLSANLSTMVDKLQANGIIPVLTTIPPRVGQDAKVLTFVTAVRNLAQTRKLPLIDFYQEVMRRRPGFSWQTTLIDSGDGVHPSGDRAGFTVGSDPYASNGAALSEVGYLLRTWLTVQKIKEIKTAVIDAPVLIGDINFDNVVNAADLQALVLAWASHVSPTPSSNWNAGADLNNDGYVNVGDLQLLVAHWGQSQ